MKLAMFTSGERSSPKSSSGSSSDPIAAKHLILERVQRTLQAKLDASTTLTGGSVTSAGRPGRQLSALQCGEVNDLLHNLWVE